MVEIAIKAKLHDRGCRPSREGWRASVFLRVLMIVALMFTVFFAVDTPGSLAHDILESEPSVAISVAAVDAAPSLGAFKSPVGSHEKAPLSPPCTGHCASHAIGLLALPVEFVAAVATTTVWLLSKGQLTYRWSSFALERPPRV